VIDPGSLPQEALLRLALNARTQPVPAQLAPGSTNTQQTGQRLLQTPVRSLAKRKKGPGAMQTFMSLLQSGELQNVLGSGAQTQRPVYQQDVSGLLTPFSMPDVAPILAMYRGQK
jgi:hypothetical protein